MKRARTLRDLAAAPTVSLTPEMDLRRVAALFVERQVSGAPVVRDGRVLGVVSMLDLLYALSGAQVPTPGERSADRSARSEGGALARDAASEFFTRYWPEGDERLVALVGGEDPRAGRSAVRTVSEAMRPPLHSLPPETELPAAADYMLAHDIHRLLVVDREKLVGVVTTADMVRAMGRDGR